MPSSNPPLPELTAAGAPFAPPAVPAGTCFALQVELAGVPEAWFAERASAPLNLSYHWRTPAGELVVHGGWRTPVPAQARSRCRVSVLVLAPPQPGPYVLEVAGVTEYRHWWADLGVPPIVVPIEVRALDRSQGHVLIAGGSGFRNVGDEALLRRAVLLCRQAAPTEGLLLAANDAAVAAETLSGLAVPMVSTLRQACFRGDAHYGACDEVFRQRWAALDEALVGSDLVQALHRATTLGFVDHAATDSFLRALSAARCLVVHGGGILTSATRSRLWEMALLCRLARRAGVPVALRSHQIGPFDNELDRSLAREMFDGAAYVSARDRGESALAALGTGTQADVHEDVDDAFDAVAAGHRSAELSARYGLTRGGYIAACYRRNPAVGVSDRSLAAFVAALEHAGTLGGCEIVLVPMGPFDVPALEDVQRRLRTASRVVVPVDWLADAPAIAQDARWLVSVPHHPLIFALQAGTPVLSPVEGAYYLAKNRGSMRLFGLENFVIDVSQPEGPARLLEAQAFIAGHGPALRRYIGQRISQLPALGAPARTAFARFMAGAPLRAAPAPPP